MTGALLVSIHDVAPATLPEARAWLDELDLRGISATVLVVPGPWRRPTLDQDDATVTWLRAAERRHEIALHGWDHGSCRVSGAGRRAVGQVLIDAELHPAGFTPPGWLASRATVQAAGEIGLRYVPSQRAVIALRRARRYPVLALSNRPGGWGEGVGADVLRRLAPVLGARRGVRIALHPDDLRQGRTRTAALAAIDATLAVRAQPMTYLDFVERGGR